MHSNIILRKNNTVYNQKKEVQMGFLFLSLAFSEFFPGLPTMEEN